MAVEFFALEKNGSIKSKTTLLQGSLSVKVKHMVRFKKANPSYCILTIDNKEIPISKQAYDALLENG
jgi:hypothetical protein